VQLDAPLVRDAYLQELQAFLADVRARCERMDLRYTLAPTDISPVLVLNDALEGLT
jgi:hypothetical protein